MSDPDSLSESVSGTLSLLLSESESEEDREDSESAGSELDRSEIGSAAEPTADSSSMTRGLMSIGSVFMFAGSCCSHDVRSVTECQIVTALQSQTYRHLNLTLSSVFREGRQKVAGQRGEKRVKGRRGRPCVGVWGRHRQRGG